MKKKLRNVLMVAAGIGLIVLTVYAYSNLINWIPRSEEEQEQICTYGYTDAPSASLRGVCRSTIVCVGGGLGLLLVGFPLIEKRYLNSKR